MTFYARALEVWTPKVTPKNISKCENVKHTKLFKSHSEDKKKRVDLVIN